MALPGGTGFLGARTLRIRLHRCPSPHRCPHEADRMRRRIGQVPSSLEAGTDPTIVGKWIAEARLARKAAEAPAGSRCKRSTDQVRDQDLVGQFKGEVAVPANAKPADRKAVYNGLTGNPQCPPVPGHLRELAISQSPQSQSAPTHSELLPQLDTRASRSTRQPQ